MLFLISVDMLSNSFKYLGKDIANSLIYATSNPFIGLFVGIIVTAIIQSSSTSTTMIVAFVASNVITLTDAVPMMIGANIGTTITSTLVSIGFISKRKEFRRAVSAGVIHDFFNIFMVLILFPLEYYYGFLSNVASQIAAYFFSPAAQPVQPRHHRVRA
jgi:solute carrier family 34 (sodium-dependent phosphate cotransporter)